MSPNSNPLSIINSLIKTDLLSGTLKRYPLQTSLRLSRHPAIHE